MEVVGYLASLLIGISLGLIGGGGSILTVPVFVYLFGVPVVTATSYSLWVVGVTSLIGTIANWRKHLVIWRIGLMFGASSIVTVTLIRRLVLPQIPEHIWLGTVSISFAVLTIVAFALLMVAAAWSMYKKRSVGYVVGKQAAGMGRVLLYGIGVGLITGFLGAGGGFVLIPALVLFLKLPMKQAVGTSLMIISINSFAGAAADAGLYAIDWHLLRFVTLIAITGVVAGGWIARWIDGEKLKRLFAVMVFTIGLFIIADNLLFHFTK